ncbi:(2Fe-2S)-binding protein [Oscillibacter sp. MSJ-2]|uniref:(2Fe-2S)-binding protein n=1 Tax=Dysosmobacter acutus TaxID=2841504 RepID=A0ABS6FFK8_9FIRM|nr:(2Fe-2S)-binding protein [Dysosmobacter acutus]MBU5628104.1 (2Fe-2S)-binding protein [Dysosmobacter acutus]
MSAPDGARVMCLCHGVTWADIRTAVDGGAETFEEVRRQTGCGKSCAMCVERIRGEVDALLGQSGRQGG